MLRPLIPHPAITGPAVTVTASAARPAAAVLELGYQLSGDLDALLIPATAAPERADGLWRHTCFEAFVRADGEGGYLELNLSPSTRWAAYRFDTYRAGMAPAPVAPADIRVRRDGDILELTVRIDLAAAYLPPHASWSLGLSAVVEDRAGAASYWALAHPPGRPDFHSPDCFALELMAPQRP